MERRNARRRRLVWFAATVCLWPLSGANIAQAGPYNSQGIVSYWAADGTANDSVGNNNGTLSGGVTYAPGVVGQAFSFNGAASVNGPVHGAQPSSLDANQVTIAFWMNDAGFMTCCQGLVTTDFYGVEISAGLPGSTQVGVNFFVSTDAGQSWHLTSDAANAAYPVAPNTWYYIVATYDGSTLRLYANGVLVRSTPWSGSISTMGANSFLSIGSEDGRQSPSAGNVARRYFAGQIDEVQIYNRALSDLEIQSLYTRYTAPWAPIFPQGTTPPPARLNNTATYDSQNNRLLVFGGSFTPGGGVDRHNDLWAYQFSTGTWSDLSPDTYPNIPSSGPVGRTNHTATWATTPQHQNDRLLVFGGCVAFTGGCPYNDLWSYQTSTGWMQLIPPAGNAPPPARAWHAAVWDSNWQSNLGANAGRLLVFGGSTWGPDDCGGNSGQLNDLWSYSYNQVDGAWEWTQLSPFTTSTASPSRRIQPGVAWDSSYSQNGAHGRLLIFGGDSCGTLQNDLWQWTDAGGWQQLQAPATGPATVPAPRTLDGAVWDSATASLLVFGGGSANGFLNDVWRYTAGGWSQVSQGLFPPGRVVGGVDTDGRGNLFVFGGMLDGGATSNDLWQLDIVPPTTNIGANTSTGSYKGGSWTNQDVSISLSAFDNTGGSGLLATYFKVDDPTCSSASSFPNFGCSIYNSAFTISNEGMHAITYFSVDNAGNVEPANPFKVNIDKTAPTITYIGRTAPNANGWNNTDVTVTWNCSDSLSGPVSSTVTTTLGTGGANQSATGTCKDLAGNTASATQTGINIDKTKPATTASVAGPQTGNGSYVSSATVTLRASDPDGAADVPATYYTVDGGAQKLYAGPFTVSALGSHQLAYWSVDRAGNTDQGRNQPLSFTVVAPTPGSVTNVTWQYIKSSPKYQALPIPPDTQATIDAAVNAATAQLQMVPLTQPEKAAYQYGVQQLGNNGYLTPGQVNTLVGLSNSIPTP